VIHKDVPIKLSEKNCEEYRKGNRETEKKNPLITKRAFENNGKRNNE